MLNIGEQFPALLAQGARSNFISRNVGQRTLQFYDAEVFHVQEVSQPALSLLGGSQQFQGAADQTEQDLHCKDR
jgi:hypothetical protein